MSRRWALGILAGIILSILSLYPQYHLRELRDGDYYGAFATCDLDEMAYASYMQALIDGRPRKSDPYTGRDESPETPQTESLFSIQFLPAYMAAMPARVLGLSASQMMPVVSVFSAFFTALALFWLIVSITDDDVISLAGTLVVLAGGALVTGIGAVNALYEGGAAYPFIPFLRRPIPSLSFPFLFALFACLWNGQKVAGQKRWVYSALAAACFGALAFSYFYLWTSAAAVMASLFLASLVLRAPNWRSDLTFQAVTGALCLLTLVPYAILVAGRNKIADKAQLLVITHQPDLWRNVEIIGAAVILLTFLALYIRAAAISDGRAQVVLALALSPIVVFNHQILTGHSLQPFHYEFYVINYVVLLAAVLLVAVYWQRYISGRRLPALAGLTAIICVAASWGCFEAVKTTEFWDDINIQRDEAMPVNLRLRELANGNIDTAKQQTTLNLESLQADGQPTVAPQAVLWARHQNTFAGQRSLEESRRRYYQLLYFSDADANWLRRALTGCGDIEACMALFGWDRFNARLSADARPLTKAEIDAEVINFDRFSREFSAADAADPLLSYLIVANRTPATLRNVDLWYIRDAGETLGEYTLYRLTPRN